MRKLLWQFTVVIKCDPVAPQKWYNMWYIDMSGKLPMCCAAKVPRVRCSAAYPTGRERIAKGLLYHGVPIVF